MTDSEALQQMLTAFDITLPAGWQDNPADTGRAVMDFLQHNGFPGTATHSQQVATEAARLAIMFDVDADAARVAGWLHDVSAVFPAAQRARVAEQLDVAVLPAERAFPMIVHQKLSVVLARDLFGIRRDAILSAIGCHTTLKASASALDTVVFVADKIAWDQAGEPPYLADIMAALDESIYHAALVYLDDLWRRRAELRLWHPDAAAARDDLRRQLRLSDTGDDGLL